MKGKCANGQERSGFLTALNKSSDVCMGIYIIAASCEYEVFVTPQVSGFGVGRWVEGAQWKGREERENVAQSKFTGKQTHYKPIAI